FACGAAAGAGLGGFCAGAGDGERAGANRRLGHWCRGGFDWETSSTSKVKRACLPQRLRRRLVMTIAAGRVRIVRVAGSGTWAKALARSDSNWGVAPGMGANAPL